MVSVIVTFFMIIVFFVSGSVVEAVKRLLMLLLDSCLKIFNLFGLHVSRTERKLHMSKEFRQTYKEIIVVRKSKENTKLKSSINIPSLITFLVALTFIIVNSLCNKCCTRWLWENNPLPQLIKSSESLEITFTAIVFSLLSFVISKLISQWKETANYRAAKKQMRQRKELLYEMSSKELLDTLKEKDNTIYQRLKAESND